MRIGNLRAAGFFFPKIQIARSIVLLLVFAAPAWATRDWKAYPAIAQLPQPQLLLAIGDVHGDYDKLVDLLTGAGIIKPAPATPQDVQWIAGNATLVCTGDMIDKWNKGVEVLELMRALQISADKAGGRFSISLGNHEAEFLAADGKGKKAVEFADELKSMNIDPSSVAQGTDSLGLGTWLRNRPVGTKAGDWFFCHAGNTHDMTVPEIEAQIEKGIDAQGFAATDLIQPNSMLEARLSPVPWWITAPQTTPPTMGVDRLRAYADALGCKHIVMGHQPDNVNFGNGVKRTAGQPFNFGNVLFLIDTGMSHGQFDGHGIILRIHQDEKWPVDTIDAKGVITPLIPS